MNAGGYSLKDRKRAFQLLMAALVTFAVNLRADSGADRRDAAVSPKFSSIVFVQAPKAIRVAGVGRFPEGSRIVLLVLGGKIKSPLVLTEGFFAAADPQVDFSAKHILFAGQKMRGDHWQIWEMNLGESGSRQITKCETDCVRPVYLPGDEVAFTNVSTASGHQQSSLEVIGLDGSNVHAITFGPGEWWLETVLRDGRIVASANAPLNETVRVKMNRLLYTLRPDGTGLESLRCEHEGQAQRAQASELEDGSIIFTENGALMQVKRGALREEKIGVSGNSYDSPSALDANTVIVGRKTVLGQRYELSVIARHGNENARTIYSDPQFDSVEPVAVTPRPTPKKFWSTLIQSAQTGYFISLDSSNSMDKAQSAGPVRRVRVIAQKAESEGELGEAAVETDGSFYVEVPANRPVRFVLLDERGNVIREERSWIWSRPGEQRGCTGCHGDKALAPENRWPMVLRKQDPPTRLEGMPSGTQAVESHGH